MYFPTIKELSFSPLPPSGPRPVRRNHHQVRVENPSIYGDLISSPFQKPVATKPVVVKKALAKYSPGSTIPSLDWQGRLRPVQVVGQSVTTKAAHREMNKSVQVEGVRMESYYIWAAVHPLVRPSLTREDPLHRPEEALGLALCLLQDNEWERKTEGLRLVRALAEHHSSVVLQELHIICKAVNKEVKTLRTVVSRDAINTMAHLFAYLRQEMDSEVVGAARTLLNKAGEYSLFIRLGVELALSTMVLSCSRDQVLRGLLSGGLSHRNSAVRATTAYILGRFLKEVGVSRVLNCRKFTSKLLPAISKLAFDSAQEVRTHARATLKLLGAHRDLSTAVGIYVPPEQQRSVKELLLKLTESKLVKKEKPHLKR